MTRHYDDPVAVRRAPVGGQVCSEDGPAEFLWRGRLYVVREVLAHWVETRPWWRGSAVRAVQGAMQPGDPDVPPAGCARLDVGERELWRVEATAGRAKGVGVFDLCFDWTAGDWTLARALD